MKVTTAWRKAPDGSVMLVESYDEAAFDYWGNTVPGFYLDAKADAEEEGDPIRELVLNVPDSAIEALFATPEVEATPDTARSPDGFDPSAAFDCALCLYAPEGRMVEPAVTVIEGYAVCYDHMGYVAQGQRFAALRSALGEGS